MDGQRNDRLVGQRLRLDQRCVIVAGAGGGGIGTAVAVAARQAGAHVVAVDREPDRLAPLLRHGTDSGAGVTTVVADVLTEEGRARILEAAGGTGRPLSGLVCVAGGIPAPYWGPALSLDEPRWREVFARNVDYVALLSAEVARAMVVSESGGSIVVVSSVSGLGAAPFHAAYGAAKAALLSLVRTLAVEWAEHGIRVNAVAPGTIETPASPSATDSARDRLAVPMGRRGRPEEIGDAVLFLLSDLAGYVTGQCLAVDGGMSVKGAHLGADNTPVFVTDPGIRAAIRGR